MKPHTHTNPSPLPSTTTALVLALASLGLTACAASLRGDLEDHPGGSFAEATAAVTESPTGTAIAPATAAQTAGQTTAGTAPAAGTAPGTAPKAAPASPFQDPAWTPPNPLLYSTAREAFFARSPAVAAAAARYRAAFERYGQVTALNDLVRQYDAFGRALKKAGVTGAAATPPRGKAFPFQGVASLQGQIVTADVAEARAAFEREVLQAAAGFEAAFQGLLYEQRAVGVLARVVGYAARTVDAARARYRSGAVSHANLIQAEMRLDDLRLRLRTAKARREAAWRRLAAVLRLGEPSASGEGEGGLAVVATLPPRPKLKLDAPLPGRPDRDEVRALAAGADGASVPAPHGGAALAADATLTQSGVRGTAVAVARARALRATLMVQLAERQLEPNLTAGLRSDQAPDLEPRSLRPAAGAPRQRPGPGGMALQGNLRFITGGPFLREARERQVAAQEGLQAALRDAPAQADQLWVALDDAVRRRRLYAGVQRSRAEQAVQVAQRGYRAGRATFFDVDAAVARALDVNLAAHAATRDAFVFAAKLAVELGAGPGGLTALGVAVDPAVTPPRGAHAREPAGAPDASGSVALAAVDPRVDRALPIAPPTPTNTRTDAPTNQVTNQVTVTTQEDAR